MRRRVHLAESGAFGDRVTHGPAYWSKKKFLVCGFSYDFPTNPKLEKYYREFIRGKVGQEIKVEFTTPAGSLFTSPCKVGKSGALTRI